MQRIICRSLHVLVWAQSIEMTYVLLLHCLLDNTVNLKDVGNSACHFFILYRTRCISGR